MNSQRFTPLSAQPGFVACKIGEHLDADQLRAALPGLASVVQIIAEQMYEKCKHGSAGKSMQPSINPLKAQPHD